ncbi:hypothetical protein [Phosphitispora fastidiosa]|uniref:hypothetical protein n=1 Tax=Phosphitispora fastidiosa TaxID=2837202 RepID=UPI001E521FDD|nr:hypothetical protein [Phosphitispora fastidiosa]MBU7006310.1 hypothetical protein [Phosphitispora fastidiosa]
MAEWALALVCMVLVAVLIWREHQFDLERKDLYNRIMAGNLHDYAANGTAPPRGRNFVKKGIKKGYQALGNPRGEADYD